MRRRQPEPVPGTVRMPELLRGPLRAHMAAVLDADGPIPDGVVSTLSSGTRRRAAFGVAMVRGVPPGAG